MPLSLYSQMTLRNLQKGVTDLDLYMTPLLRSETLNTPISENGYFDQQYGENTKLYVGSDTALKNSVF